MPWMPAAPTGGHIFNIRNPWRDQLVPASFRGAEFHCEHNALESGRRMIQHEFPKRDANYAEDMGHKAISWAVRGYCISYPYDVSGSGLYSTDYRTARDALVRELDRGQSGRLQVQTLPSLDVWCERYRLTEEEGKGGYCTFDMQFIESGAAPFALDDTTTALVMASANLRTQILAQLAGNPAQAASAGL